jgi:transcriptional regulator with XRE-family HTH domain
VVLISTTMIPLKDWREKRGLSKRRLASLAGVSHVTIVRIESGQISPTVTMMEKLAEALGISVRDFFPGESSRDRHGKRREKRHGKG